MAYTDKYGITDLETIYKHVELGLSWDCDGDNLLDKAQRYPCFLVTPKHSNGEHYHIGLTRKSAVELRDWLDAFLKDVEIRDA